MNAIPFSSAAANASVHACSRHAHILGPRFCSECRAPLCTACARTRAHRTCPSCNEAAGRKASEYDVGWYATLLVDGFVHALSTLKTVLLPVGIAVSVLGLVGFLAAFGSISGAELGATDADSIVGVAGMWLPILILGALWAQPGLVVPTVRPVSFWRRSLRSVVGALVPLSALGLLSVVGVGLALASDSLSSLAFTVVLALVSLVLAFVAFAFSSLVLPVQAAYAIGERSLLSALKLPFQGGAGAVAMFSLTWMLMLSSVYSGAYGMLVVLVVLGLFAPWVGIVGGVISCATGLVVLLLLMAAYASASVRLCEDRATLRQR